jgi:hypothetical protein
MLFGEMIAAYSYNHSKCQTSFCEQNTEFLVVETDGAYINRNYCALKLYNILIKGTFRTVLRRSLRNKVVWSLRPPTSPQHMVSG